MVLLFPTRLGNSQSFPFRRACKNIYTLFLAEAECTSSLCLPKLTLSVCPHLLSQSVCPTSLPCTLLSHIIGRILAFHKVTPRNTLSSHLEPQRYCFHGLNSRNLQNFTTLRVDRDQGPATTMSGCSWGRVGKPLVPSTQHWQPGLGAAELQLPGEGHKGPPFCHFHYRN